MSQQMAAPVGKPTKLHHRNHSTVLYENEIKENNARGAGGGFFPGGKVWWVFEGRFVANLSARPR